MPADGPLRIAVVCPYDLARPGGVQGQAIGLAAALERRGHRAAVLAPDARPRGWTSPGTYVVGRSVGVRANGSVAPVCLDPLAAGRAVRAARAWGTDVVHLHEPLAPVVGYGFLWSHPWPNVATFHRAGGGGGYRLPGPAARWVLSRIDVACAVSEPAQETAAAALGGDYEILYNGVEVERFASAEPTPSDVPAVLFLGRHEQRKGLGVLLEAFAAVRTPAVLWIAGDGPESARLRAQYPESAGVHWLGVLDDDEVASRLAGAAALVAPSLGGESFGMVLLEAMAAGCAVVASDIRGYRAAAGGHAVLVPPGDPAAVAAALDDLLAAPQPAQVLRSAFDHASRWSMDRLAERYVDLYRQALSARRGAGEIRADGTSVTAR